MGVCQNRQHMFCRPREAHDRVLEKGVEECSRSTVLNAACYWSSNHCISAQTFESVTAKLNHKRS